ncbi:alpha/beta hydrolase [Streptomyces sp. NPDC090036]|uniref:alpha/beta hydrolase n=1 Tax=Streptomyces sp. NPDC090036 TaxID=3365926 RepID=UPI0037F87916
MTGRADGTGPAGRPGSVPGLPLLGAGPGAAASLPARGLRRGLEHPGGPRSVRDVTRSDIPTLVVSGGFDSRTGADNGPYVARTLSRATVVTIPYVPHGAIVHSKCTQAITVSFFDTATAPNTACVKDLKPAVRDRSMRRPGPACPPRDRLTVAFRASIAS